MPSIEWGGQKQQAFVKATQLARNLGFQDALTRFGRIQKLRQGRAVLSCSWVKAGVEFGNRRQASFTAHHT